MADGWDLAGAIISLIFGIILMSSALAQVLTAVIMAYFVAVWMVAKRIIRMISSLRIRKIRKALDAEIPGRSWGRFLPCVY